MSHRAGEDQSFSSYYSDHKPIRSGSCRRVQYKIYQITQRTESGEIKPSHYTAYIHLASIIPPEKICLEELPPTPVTRHITFGPTTDGWIGFGTLSPTDHNNSVDGTPLPNDVREPITSVATVHTFNPNSLESEVQDWIQETITEIVSTNI